MCEVGHPVYIVYTLESMYIRTQSCNLYFINVIVSVYVHGCGSVVAYITHMSEYRKEKGRVYINMVVYIPMFHYR